MVELRYARRYKRLRMVSKISKGTEKSDLDFEQNEESNKTCYVL